MLKEVEMPHPLNLSVVDRMLAHHPSSGKPGSDDKIDADRQGLLVCVKIHGVDIPRLGDAQSCFEKFVLHLRSRLPGPSRLAWQGAARPSRTLRAAARWPLAILDRRPTPRPGEGRSGRRDGLPALTKGYPDARRHLGSALTHSVFKRGQKRDPLLRKLMNL